MSLSVINRGGSILALALAILILAPMGKAQTTELERFRLFNDCEPIYPLVEGLPSDSDAAEIGLTEGAIQAAVESLLSSARLYSDRFVDSMLYVNVSVVGRAFVTRLEYHKRVIDLASGNMWQAATWSTAIAGSHGRDANFILVTVFELMDLFLVEFLRVNEGSC